jgi:hypothetical protein
MCGRATLVLGFESRMTRPTVFPVVLSLQASYMDWLGCHQPGPQVHYSPLENFKIKEN